MNVSLSVPPEPNLNSSLACKEKKSFKISTGNRPPVLKASIMKLKSSRQIIGNFAEVRCLILCLTQILYSVCKDENHPHWVFLLQIRDFVRYMLMHEMSDEQVTAMDSALRRLMNTRMDLSRCRSEPPTSDNVEQSELSDEDDAVDHRNSLYSPPLTWKGRTIVRRLFWNVGVICCKDSIWSCILRCTFSAGLTLEFLLGLI